MNPLAAASLGVTPRPDHLRHLRSEPQVVRGCVSRAVRELMHWRIGGGAAPDPDHFVTAALSALRTQRDWDSAERLRTSKLVERGARAFIASPLGNRLLRLPIGRIAGVGDDPAAADVVVRDERGRLHAIGITAHRTAIVACGQADRIVRRLPADEAGGLGAVTVHLFSLVTGKRLCFSRSPHRTKGAPPYAEVA